MQDRLNAILEGLIEKGAITSFEQDGEEGVYLCETPLFSQFDHRTWLQFETTGDLMRVRFRHLCAYLDTEDGVSARDLLGILLKNRGGHRNTSAYVALLSNQDYLFVTLENTHFYLLKWSDGDIADALSAQFLDLMGGLAVGEPPKPIVMFSQRS